MNSEPWILITNLHQHPEWGNYTKAHLARLCKNIYAKHMQIEQNFLDDKSTVSGLKWRFSRTRCPKKISVLILLASITTLILWMSGFSAEKKTFIMTFKQIPYELLVSYHSSSSENKWLFTGLKNCELESFSLFFRYFN